MWSGLARLSVGYPTQKHKLSVYFFVPEEKNCVAVAIGLQLFLPPKHARDVHAPGTFIPNQTRAAPQRRNLHNHSHDSLAAGTTELPGGPAER
jgi:hypothetical protein